MKDQEIREAVENIEGYLEYDSYLGEYEKNALPTLLNLAQEYLSIKGMPEEKRENYQDRPYQLGYQDGSNGTIKQCKLVMMKMANKLCKKIDEDFEVEEIYGTPLELNGKKVIYEEEVLNAVKLYNIRLKKLIHDLIGERE